MSRLGSPYTLKSLSLRNRIVMSPMCQYSVDAEDGKPNDWHFVHYASRAIGGTGLIIMEMTDVEPDGRITNRDLGLWSDEHVPAFKRVIGEMHKYGAKVGIQIAHAGRKALDAEPPVGPWNEPFDKGEKTPRALTTEEAWTMVGKFADAARRAVEAGVDTIELHGAHGYLIHQFHSPGINKRDDEFGRDYAKFGVEVIRAVKKVLPPEMPLIMRVSAIEYAEYGYDAEHILEMCKAYRDAGVDMFDVSTGGEGGPAVKRKPGNYPGYQLPFARAVKEALNVPVMAVGLLDDPKLAESALGNGDADLIAVGRGMLRNPYWAVDALRELGDTAPVVEAYKRGY
ncbi:NADH:flavin oxidoreductase/NADH oxidase [Cohnella lubricantis]|uniref:NADH:flavin oxidoreductase/NADH oxidase n=1 Tax=Cohnella lubricantis TaxID=2163172 RepID=A0A841T9Q6_9BACL|nr:NADH:flavin oxidoreductase/NADH oxidase [Cohnella lubricantis]MBB6676755.1 NADH:flavin oxidoreductase/NADH oxidase [Cohnella lubricantis]MBP2117801.1 2,4-dienoyl-CoA reductase-like NADH-dependent reductase (Old Yellow Enzyme family) [Cohnella lubricantis]